MNEERADVGTGEVRVVVADDHPIVRTGISRLLAATRGIVVVGEAADGAEAVRLAAEQEPDVVLMDLRMPVLDGVEATRLLRASESAPRVLILTTYETDDDILGAIEAGASGYLLKAVPEEEIVAGVLAAAAGETVLAPAIAARLVQHVRSDPDAPARPALSIREQEVLRLVADGLSNPEIGRRLFISDTTVKTHLLHAFEKLGVNDRTRAVVVAMERGLL